MNQKYKRLFGLDCIRALAITLVLVSHCSFLLFPETSNLPLDILRLMGAVGVDLFFVLSGYLIGGILLELFTEKESLNWSDLFRFWKRRWLRTLPNYFLILVLNIVLAIIIGFPLPKNTFLYGLFLQNFAWSHPNFFTEAWSLSIEEYAYVFLPFTLFLCALIYSERNKNKLFFTVTIVTIALLTLFKIHYFLLTNISDYHSWSSSFRKVVVYRMDSIYYGFLGIYVVKSFNGFITKNKTKLIFIGLLTFLGLHIIMYVFNLKPEKDIWFYVFIYLQTISFSLLLGFPYFLSLKANLRFKHIIEFISTRSYSMYLINYSLILLGLQQVVDIKKHGLPEKIGVVVFFLLITFVASNLLYVYFEKPILKYRNQKFPR